MAKNYAIMRIQKLTTNNDFARAINHNARQYGNTPGADKSKAHLNIITGPAPNYSIIKENLSLRNKMIKDSTGYKVKKNRVRGFELLFAVNQNFMSNKALRDEYFKLAEEWAKDTFGEHNFLNKIIHMDEDGACHCHIMVTCVDVDEKDQINKYCANHWVSDRQSLTALQDSWHSKVEHLGLERGKSAKYTHNYHLTKQEYTKLLQKDIDNVRALPQEQQELLAVKGLRAQRQAEQIAEQIKSEEILRNINFNKLLEDLSIDDFQL